MVKTKTKTNPSFDGVFYAYGKGVPKDLSKAKYWIKKAYEGGGLWSQERKDYAEEIWNEFNLWEH